MATQYYRELFPERRLIGEATGAILNAIFLGARFTLFLFTHF